ncbi:MAG: hypothetical protein KME55_22785 [Nostoc indistinguendum CM1-VF10]|jgi:hypothetical protein|nr:hypothetical protein [Nostoc indistinguendum CM1-VF10]
MMVFVTVHALFIYRQITYFIVNPYTFIAENFSLSPSLTVNHLTNTFQTPPPTVLGDSATMALFTPLRVINTKIREQGEQGEQGRQGEMNKEAIKDHKDLEYRLNK